MQIHCSVCEAEINQSSPHPRNRISILVSAFFFYYSLMCPDRLWDPANRQVQGNLSPGLRPSESDADRLLVHLVPTLRMSGAVLHMAMRRYFVYKGTVSPGFLELIFLYLI
jgi:hypothetical protein